MATPSAPCSATAEILASRPRSFPVRGSLMCPSRKPPRTAEKTEHGHIRAVALKFSLVISEVRRSDMTTRLWTRFALAFLVLVASAHTTGAATITYSYAGSCTAGCGEVGLDVGDSVSGFIAFRDSELIPGNPYPDPVSFSFVFGGRAAQRHDGCRAWPLRLPSATLSGTTFAGNSPTGPDVISCAAQHRGKWRCTSASPSHPPGRPLVRHP
jgi:hypothetical protein